MREIIADLNALRAPAEPLKFLSDAGTDKTEGNAIMAELKAVMDANPGILALSAPQIGIAKRVFCIRFNDAIKTFINPIVTKKKGMVIAPEAFVNMPGKEILIGRPEEVTVVYYGEDFSYGDNKLLGAAARLFDQQSQLLDGILPDELGLVSDVEKDGSLSSLTQDELKEIVDFYKNKYIPTKLKAYEGVISPEELKSYKRLKFAESVINGRTQVVESEAEVKARNKTNRDAVKAVALSGKMADMQKKAANRAQLSQYLRRKK
jgi:peptide deformylase